MATDTPACRPSRQRWLLAIASHRPLKRLFPDEGVIEVRVALVG